MNVGKLAVAALCVPLVLGVPSGASAQRWMKSFDVGSVHAEGASYVSGFGPHAGLLMVETNQSSFAAAFTVPPEHRPGEPIFLGIFWHTNSTTPCDIHLQPNSLSVARIGRTHIQGTASVSAGLEPLDGSIVLNATAANTTNLKIYTITSPDGTTNLQPFDSINFSLFRRPNNSSDTCTGSLTIQGIAVAIL